MKEIEHLSLFNPPEGTHAVVIPVLGEVWPKKPYTYTTPMKTGYAKLAKMIWKKIDINVGVLQQTRGVTPHPLTVLDDKNKIRLPGKKGAKGHSQWKPLRYHLITLPTRRFKETALDSEYLSAQVHAMTKLFDGRIPWLNDTMQVVMPQLCDEGMPWSDIRKFVEIWLPGDRWVVISGKEGTIT
jgi:hypothetical protein